MKYVFISGASSDLGGAVAKVFASNNYNLILGYNTREDNVIKLRDEIKSIYGIDSIIYKLDITNEIEVEKLFSDYDIEILINNAAKSLDNYIEDKSYDEFMGVVSINLGGTYLMCKYAKSAKYIINISSRDGIDTYNPISLDYSSSKAGIINLSRNLSLYYLDKKIYCVCPGWIDTESVKEMNPNYLKEEMERIGQTKLVDKEYVANSIYNLVNSEVESGSVIIIDEKE